jgi:hypothetical protein
MDILRLNIEALSDGYIVLPGAVEVRQLSSNSLEQCITEINLVGLHVGVQFLRKGL